MLSSSGNKVLFMTLMMLFLPFAALAETGQPQSNTSADVREDPFADADRLLNQGGVENSHQALEIYKNAVDKTPGDYEANWKCAKAHYLYAEACRQQNKAGWEEICKDFGKAGFGYGEKAISLEPGKVEGNIYYGLCVWKYSDGVSILTALKEGLKGSTQGAFEKSYDLDKKFDNGWPMKALGRFWQQLPWPLRDYEASRKYLTEHHKYFPDDPEGLVFLSETLIDLNVKAEAKPLLEKAAKNQANLFYRDKARELLTNQY